MHWRSTPLLRASHINHIANAAPSPASHLPLYCAVLTLLPQQEVPPVLSRFIHPYVFVTPFVSLLCLLELKLSLNLSPSLTSPSVVLRVTALPSAPTPAPAAAVAPPPRAVAPPARADPPSVVAFPVGLPPTSSSSGLPVALHLAPLALLSPAVLPAPGGAANQKLS